MYLMPAVIRDKCSHENRYTIISEILTQNFGVDEAVRFQVKNLRKKLTRNRKAVLFRLLEKSDIVSQAYHRKDYI